MLSKILFGFSVIYKKTASMLLLIFTCLIVLYGLFSGFALILDLLIGVSSINWTYQNGVVGGYSPIATVIVDLFLLIIVAYSIGDQAEAEIRGETC